MGNCGRFCELCGGEAVAYCSADSAFLCLSCDAKVHGANFLVARHIRQIVCSKCHNFTDEQVSGVGFKANVSICPTCSPAVSAASADDDLDSLSSSSSSTCVSSGALSSSSCAAAAAAAPKEEKRGGRFGFNSPVSVRDLQKVVTWGVGPKAVGILVNWCKRLGLDDDGAGAVVRMACKALGVCSGRLTVLPFRVCLVASLWFGIRFSGVTRSLSTSSQAVKRLEEVTGVPAKFILAAGSKLERLHKAAKHQPKNEQMLKEGWAES